MTPHSSRSNELPGRAAIGYLFADGLRTNVLHLPVRGVGDGGIYTTAADVRALWAAFVDGRIVPSHWVTEMTRPRSDARDGRQYGLGFWLRASTGRSRSRATTPESRFARSTTPEPI